MLAGKHHCNQTEQFLPAVVSLGAKLSGLMQLMPTGTDSAQATLLEL